MTLNGIFLELKGSIKAKYIYGFKNWNVNSPIQRIVT
jgi:hypothetical protein